MAREANENNHYENPKLHFLQWRTFGAESTARCTFKDQARSTLDVTDQPSNSLQSPRQDQNGPIFVSAVPIGDEEEFASIRQNENLAIWRIQRILFWASTLAIVCVVLASVVLGYCGTGNCQFSNDESMPTTSAQGIETTTRNASTVPTAQPSPSVLTPLPTPSRFSSLAPNVEGEFNSSQSPNQRSSAMPESLTPTVQPDSATSRPTRKDASSEAGLDPSLNGTMAPVSAAMTLPPSRQPVVSQPTSNATSLEPTGKEGTNLPTETLATDSSSNTTMPSEPIRENVGTFPPSNPPEGTITQAPIPNEAPTSEPIVPLTQSPIVAPAAPGQSPTIAPTSAPTQRATTAPTITPTERPTIAPTFAPTTSPTPSPTMAPTDSPTKRPTTTPTEAPTIKPTKAPTRSPSQSPSSRPTTKPVSIDPEVVQLVQQGTSNARGYSLVDELLSQDCHSATRYFEFSQLFIDIETVEDPVVAVCTVCVAAQREAPMTWDCVQAFSGFPSTEWCRAAGCSEGVPCNFCQ